MEQYRANCKKVIYTDERKKLEEKSLEKLLETLDEKNFKTFASSESSTFAFIDVLNKKLKSTYSS